MSESEVDGRLQRREAHVAEPLCACGFDPVWLGCSDDTRISRVYHPGSGPIKSDAIGLALMDLGLGSIVVSAPHAFEEGPGFESRRAHHLKPLCGRGFPSFVQPQSLAVKSLG